MQNKPKESLYLALCLLVITLAGGGYLMFGSFTQPQKNTPTKHKQQIALQQAKQLLKEAEENPSPETIKKAQESINAIRNTRTQKTFNKRLSAIRSELSRETVATDAVKATQTSPSQGLKETTQKIIDGVKNQKKKAELQALLDAIVITPETPEIDAQIPEQAPPSTNRPAPVSPTPNPTPNPVPAPRDVPKTPEVPPVAEPENSTPQTPPTETPQETTPTPPAD
ncbi:hypothetical protein ACVRWQ_05725 [Streptococcus phocae subsp. salmonis]|uniref:hypothetical protein n=1 Tax=Streptococcus phocae TaxID=119224 RepID=UPI000531464A|nr:hypothetical protein [Streptococcus phocae]KGR73262.1 hypothetical protein NX86_01405 [Streptococcus phocae subsp. salmonis]